MKTTAPPVQGLFRLLQTRVVTLVMRLTRSRSWRHSARASVVLDAVLATASDSVFFVDARGKVRDCNLVAEQTFGRERSEVIGRGIALYLPSLAFSTLRRRAKGMGHDSLTLEMPGRLETLATDSSGSTFPVSVAVCSLSVWGNKGCLVRIRDDSRREADRREIRRLTDQLGIAKRALEHRNSVSPSKHDADISDEKGSLNVPEAHGSRTLVHDILRNAKFGQDYLGTSPQEMLCEYFSNIELIGTKLLGLMDMPQLKASEDANGEC